jgi:hypothetical protein
MEFFVVVVGILAALAVDDWRQARADRALEEHLLSSLLDDLEDDQVDAELQLGFEQADREAVDHLLALFQHPLAPDNPTRGMTPDEVDESLNELWNRGELEVADATFSEMISTGSFRVIRNRVLRREITTYYMRAERLLRVPQRQIDPRPDFLSALAEVGVVPGYAAGLPDLVERLRSDPTIASHALRMRRYYDQTLTLDFLGETRGELMQSVRAELELLR